MNDARSGRLYPTPGFYVKQAALTRGDVKR
jgi:hypothetical protein